MQTERPYCSECGTEMSFRLGQYECPSCGHTQAPAAQPDPASTRRSPPPGSGSWDPGAQYRTQSSELPPPPMHAGGYASPGGFGSPDKPAAGSGDPLYTEKCIYMGLQAVGMLIVVGVTLAVGSQLQNMPASPGNMGGGEVFAGMMVAVILGAAIGLGLLWLTLFGQMPWLKWSCLGCSGVATLLMAGSLLAGGAAAGMYGQPGSAASNSIQVLISIWFLSILWRDIQNMTS